MPAKKKAKKAAVKTAVKAKKTAAGAKKKAAGAKKKTAPKKKANKPAKKAMVKAQPTKPAPVKAQPTIPAPIKSAETSKKEMVECSHCLGVGRCTAGEVFDKDRHQSLFQEQRLTSCHDCLTAAGKAPNSKKLVTCRICQGKGEVEKE